MDAYSSGEELLVKARKPYTITKQRERWSEEEHNRFLEALKLYGRAWQRIEEHIGTKTAVQIRSHAQKFFSKLEKEALVKGVPIAQAIDIAIPPPRPKRKPSNPYPRKTGTVCSPNSQVKEKEGKHTPACPDSAPLVVNLEKEIQIEKHACDDDEKIAKATCSIDNCSEVAQKLPNLKEFVPVIEKRSESNATDSPNTKHQPDSVEITQNDPKNETLAAKCYPRHAPVQILDASQGFSSDVSYQEPKSQMEFSGHPVLFSNPAFSGVVDRPISNFRSSNQQMNPGFHALYNPFPSNQGNYSSFLQMSATFPNMAAIAAATVAAATAWWTVHGLLPLPGPFPGGFAFPPPSVDSPFVNVEKEENDLQVPGSQNMSKSSATLSPSPDSGELVDTGVAAANDEAAPPLSGEKDTSQVKSKLVDRSSCGSNTPSGSGVETDAFGKNDEGNGELKEAVENHTVSEVNGRRLRIVGNTNDNWKEVSDEGRVAFQALFSRERLPQRFTPTNNTTYKDQDQDINYAIPDQTQNSDRTQELKPSQLDLNTKPLEFTSGDQGSQTPETVNNTSNKEGVLTINVFQVKMTGNRTGFKPYKRCSVESRMINSGNQEQVNCSKRLRVHGEASM